MYCNKVWYRVLECTGHEPGRPSTKGSAALKHVDASSASTVETKPPVEKKNIYWYPKPDFCTYKCTRYVAAVASSGQSSHRIVEHVMWTAVFT